MTNIMIVDDSRTSRKILKTILEGEGYHVICEAKDGEECLLKYKEFKPDLVTLDITMPKMNGIEALEELIKIDADAKVIMISAAGQTNKMLDAVKLGAMEFITKPYEKTQVTETVKRILQ